MANLNLDLKIEKKDLIAAVNAVDTAATKTTEFVKNNVDVDAISFQDGFNVLGFLAKLNEAKTAFNDALSLIDKNKFQSISLSIGTIDLTISAKE